MANTQVHIAYSTTFNTQDNQLIGIMQKELATSAFRVFRGALRPEPDFVVRSADLAEQLILACDYETALAIYQTAKSESEI